MGGFDLRDLTVPVIVAPMAGGPSTPALAAAGTNAGGLGFLPAGYLTADAFAERVGQARELTSGPLGANLFVPQPDAAQADEIARYAMALAPEAGDHGVALGNPVFSDDAWSSKMEVLLDLHPEAASFTFGLPNPAEFQRLRASGITTIATVTTVAEAEMAAASGADVLVAQGPEAGGHRGTFDPTARPSEVPLIELLTGVRAGVGVPVVAAGGLTTADDVNRAIRAGASAAQLGTAFLLADEAGSSPVHRAALKDPQFIETAVTKTFSGRYARGLRNRFIDAHEDHAPFGYPQVHYLTGPLRAAAMRAGDPHTTNVWAGTGFRGITSAPVAEIMAGLT